MNYDIMEDTVRKLCHSLTHEPERWDIEVHTLEDTKTGVQYWIHPHTMFELFNGRGKTQVFSHEQGLRVRQAFEKLCVIKATIAQEKVIKSLHPPQPELSLLSRLLSYLTQGPL